MSLRGTRNKSWIVVTACLCSARRAIAALHPKQAHDATPVTNTTSLLRAAELWEKESKTASRFRDVGMTHGRPAGKPSETKKGEVEGGPKKKAPVGVGARRRAEEAAELC